MTRRESNKVKYIYFIMSVLVILIHSINNETKFQRFFSEFGIGQFAVPTFFLISGFLFFRPIRGITDVRNKLKKRVHTLLIPYLLWNLIYYAIHLLIHPGSGIDLNTAIMAGFNYTYNPAFWFVHQLILLNILSLVFYYALNDKKTMTLLFVLVSLMIFLSIDIPYINGDAVIYYFSGGVFAKYYNLSGAKFISKKNALIALLFAIVFYIVNRYIYYKTVPNPIQYGFLILTTVYIRLSFAFTIFYAVDLFFNYDKVLGFMEHTFFLYAIHYMIVKAMIMAMRFVTYKYLPADTFLTIETIVFLMSPVVCIIVNYYLSRYMKKKFNKIYSVLTGDR